MTGRDKVYHLAATDWRDAHIYDPLLTLGRHAFAWEWLRRHPRYRDAWQGGASTDRPEAVARQAGRAFGLVSLVDPCLDAVRARPIWRADVDRSVVVAEVLDVEPPPCEGLDLLAVASLVTLEIAPNDDQHLLISNGGASIRIDVIRGTLLGGRALLDFRMWGVARLRYPLLTLRRLVELVVTGKLKRTLFPLERHAMRWVLELRTADAVAQGASHRDIAQVLFGAIAITDRSRGTEAARSRVRRLVRIVRHRCRDGGHLDFLDGR